MFCQQSLLISSDRKLSTEKSNIVSETEYSIDKYLNQIYYLNDYEIATK